MLLTERLYKLIDIQGLDDTLMQEPRYGIELEYENVPLRGMAERPNFRHWRLNGDGSLRNYGIELTSVPLSEVQLLPALDEVAPFIEQSRAIATERCGLHVHINVQPYTFGQVWSFITLYALMEPSIYESYAQGRKHSIFSVPLMYNTLQVSRLAEDCKQAREENRRSLHMHCLRTPKYSALNTGMCMENFGTLEMRQPYCTTDLSAAYGWILFCTRLRDMGMSYNDPLSVIALFETIGLNQLQQELFGTTITVEEKDQDFAEDAAYAIASRPETKWQDISWTMEGGV